MNPKLETAMRVTAQALPDLAGIVDTHSFVPDDSILAIFERRDETTYAYQPGVIEDVDQEHVNFAFAVTAYMAANDIVGRSEGKDDPLLWGMVANLCGQEYVRRFMSAPGRADRFAAQFEERYPGVVYRDRTPEAVYAAIAGGALLN